MSACEQGAKWDEIVAEAIKEDRELLDRLAD